MDQKKKTFFKKKQQYPQQNIVLQKKKPGKSEYQEYLKTVATNSIKNKKKKQKEKKIEQKQQNFLLTHQSSFGTSSVVQTKEDEEEEVSEYVFNKELNDQAKKHIDKYEYSKTGKTLTNDKYLNTQNINNSNIWYFLGSRNPKIVTDLDVLDIAFNIDIEYETQSNDLPNQYILDFDLGLKHPKNKVHCVVCKKDIDTFSCSFSQEEPLGFVHNSCLKFLYL